MEEKLTSFFRFEDLRVYDKSLDYYTWLTAQVKNADEFSRKSILMPFLDTAARISMNIADGSSNHKSEFVDYLKYAKSHSSLPTQLFIVFTMDSCSMLTSGSGFSLTTYSIFVFWIN